MTYNFDYWRIVEHVLLTKGYDDVPYDAVAFLLRQCSVA